MLIIGMGTEAIIFFFSAFEPPHVEVDWSIVYPELSGDDPNAGHIAKMNKSLQKQYADEDAERLLSEKLDKMLQAARVDVSLFTSLNANINKLSDVASNMSTTADVVSVNANYAKEVSKLTDTLGRLNTMYAEQLSVSARQMELQQLANEKQMTEVSKTQVAMSQIADALHQSIKDSAAYKQEVAELSEKVKSLNALYANMLTALSSINKV
jgi:gliding motility-associated protein GldL